MYNTAGRPYRERGLGQVWGKLKLLLVCSRVVWIMGQLKIRGIRLFWPYVLSLNTLYNSTWLRSDKEMR